ncbi:undecaprenyldiphospho-muramoylpentapeptide beta-N-acetylglucosaminyltransferase [Aestuariimicrobium soli]|uniref:undecaprenyldiphospho-muramoylpentapeptide beta-N-acetylglucosaminyltransferase n=1 Tax=Aestuariimicrobium soli TaxID=2035834 RepID=UPI003EBBE9CB
MVNVVLAGGGTAGHTSPLIATAEVLRDRGATCSAIGTARGLETRVIPAAGLELDLVEPVPLPRTPNLDLVKVPWRLAGSVRQAGRILKQRRADVLVGFGGYVSMPAYLAARAQGIPVVIHEQNAVPGLANKVAARFARTTAVSFPDTPLPGARFIGLPVRCAITELASESLAGRATRRREARTALGLDPERRTVLVSGGSQGARSINTALLAARDQLLGQGWQVLHVWGPKNFTEHTEVVTGDSGARYVPVAFVDRMEDAYAAADLMVGRSGAGTVVETAVVGLPAIFAPLPHGNGEQARNAASLVAAHGAVLVPDSELDGARLSSEVSAILGDDARLARMAKAGPALMPADAAGVLAELVLTAAGGRHGAA